jgi:hypothetical protein
MFPTFCWQEMSMLAPFVRWRCQELIRAGRLGEVAPDLYEYRRRHLGRFFMRPLAVC